MQRHRKYDRKNQIGIAPEWQSQQGFILTQTSKELRCYYQMDDFLVVFLPIHSIKHFNHHKN